MLRRILGLTLLLEGLSGIFGNILVSFSGSARMGDPDVAVQGHVVFSPTLSHLLSLLEGDVPEADNMSCPVSFAEEAVSKLIMGVPRRFRWVTFLVSEEALRHNRVSGNVVRLSVSAIYNEHQKAKTWKRRPFYTPPPRLARAASLVNGLSSTSSTGGESVPNHDPLVDTHRRLIGEVFFLRSQAQNMMARWDLLVQQVKASARWELMKEWLEKRVEHWDPEEEYRQHLFLSGGIDQQSGSFSRIVTLRSVVGSRFSEEPSF
ncbi:hypothetical protein DY000_02053081 [Brassica cretica]|uniref:Uncharacterized protein n=1 Tax=Brassica cretica TaxID=69181 RepID=A0ABQ7AFJ8_BRACR|nr:hypothetical protein DY000_02053081 [Brassica cretica]